MWRVAHKSLLQPADVHAFIETIHTHRTFFDAGREVLVARAPGRLDLMGGIADYSGSLVLELPLADATFAAVQRTREPTVTIRSLAATSFGATIDVAIAVDDLTPEVGPLSYQQASALLTRGEATAWAAYVAGALVVLQRERGLRVSGGLRILIDSAVPPGKGVSSSAALEVASMLAICAALDYTLPAQDLAHLCQMVENLVVGAPCGIMDQMTVACGEADRLVQLRCQPAELLASVVIPADLEVWGIDSGIRHAVSGGDYTSVRIGAFMGYRIIAELAGLPITSAQMGRVSVQDDRWGGYLANLTPSEWEQTYREYIPQTMQGEEFLARYHGSTDPITRIDPARHYAVRLPTQHPIYEHYRVRLFAALLNKGAGASVSELLGELMYQSHASYSACGLGSNGTDRLVELVRVAGVEHGLYGAKITGGGSGGTVAILARAGSRRYIEAIATAYQTETGLKPTIIGGSSAGAAQFGTLRLLPHSDDAHTPHT